MEIPTWSLRIHRLVRYVVTAVRPFHADLTITLQAIRAQVEIGPRAEQNVSVFQYAAEQNVLRVGEFQTAHPRLRVVFGQVDLFVIVTESLMIPLRIDVRPFRGESVMEMVILTNRSGSG